MTTSANKPAKGYDAFYSAFDSPLMKQLRQEAYGEDIDQHSWVTADELRSDIGRLSLTSGSRLLDVGCGPGGPLIFAVQATGCTGMGLDVSEPAIASGCARARRVQLQERVTLLCADLDHPIPESDQSFDAAMALDVVLHLRNRRAFFHEMARLLRGAGRFLFTDAGVVTGSISNDEVQWRSSNGYTQFVPAGFNEASLDDAGFRLIGIEDRTASVVLNANGRLKFVLAHRDEIETLSGKQEFGRQQKYLETVVALSERKALSRIMYVAEVDANR